MAAILLIACNLWTFILSINVHRLHAINNISCFLHYFGVQIFKLNNIVLLYSHPSYDKALDLETVVEYDIQAGGSSGSRARGGLDSGLVLVGHVLTGVLVIVVHVLAGVLVIAVHVLAGVLVVVLGGGSCSGSDSDH